MPHAETLADRDLVLATPPVVVIANQGKKQFLLGRVEQLNDPLPKAVVPIRFAARPRQTIRQAVMNGLKAAGLKPDPHMGWVLPSPEEASGAVVSDRQLPKAIVLEVASASNDTTGTFGWVDAEETLATLTPEHSKLVTEVLDDSARLQTGRPNLEEGHVPVIDQPLSLQAGQDPATYATAWRIESEMHRGMPDLRRAVLATAFRSISSHDRGTGRPTPFDLDTIRIAIAGPLEARSITDSEVEAISLLAVGISLVRKRTLADARVGSTEGLLQTGQTESPFSLGSVRAGLLRVSTRTPVWDSYSSKHPGPMSAGRRTFADVQLLKFGRSLTD